MKSNSHKNSWTIKLNQTFDLWTLDVCKTGVENQWQFCQRLRYFIWQVFFMFSRPQNTIFVQANLYHSLNNPTQSIGLCLIEFGCQTQSKTIQWTSSWFVWLSLIGLEIELAHSLVFDLVQWPNLCTGQFQNRPSPPRQTPGHLTFMKNFGQILRYVASLDGQKPHPFELQRGSNFSPSRHVKATVETSSAKFSFTTNSLFSLSSLHTLNKGIFHNITI